MRNRQAFTMVELVFVIVVIGILSAIALPKFSDSADSAYHVKAKTTLATIRNALATQRQQRILRGDFSNIADLGLDSAGVAHSGIVFDHFSVDAAGTYTAIYDYPINGCNGTQLACWTRTDATHYVYKFSNSSTGNDGKAKFILQNNRLDCDSDTADCALLQ